MQLQTQNFEPVKLANDRYIGFGHCVTNCGVTAVVTGWYPEIGCFQLREPKTGGGFKVDFWPGNPKLCA